MRELLDRVCLGTGDEAGTGLFLLTLPTGYGKTHTVLDFVFDNIDRFREAGRRVFFITNLKKNLPHEALRQRFSVAGREGEYDRGVIFLDSNASCVVKNLAEVEDDVPESFRTEVFRRLTSYVRDVTAGNLRTDLAKMLEDRIRTELEPAFRRELIGRLQGLRGTDNRLQAIRSDPEFQWIARLYPAVFSSEKTVLFMSVDKFLTRNTTLVEPSYLFTERLTENAVVFIDEVDASKQIVLDWIIENGVRHRVNLLDLFLNIHGNLTQSECPEWLLRDSQKRSEAAARHNWPALHGMVQTFREKAEAIFTGFNLQHTCKAHPDFAVNQRSFPLDSAVRTVLNQFRLDEAEVEFITESVMAGDAPYGLNQPEGTDREDFYVNGFRYYDFVDREEHDTLSKIYMYDYTRTPEAWLLGLCNQAMVVGISATAGLPTNLGNYDLEYLAARLGHRFFRPSAADVARLGDGFSEVTRGYSDIDLRVRFLGAEGDDAIRELLREAFQDEEAAEWLITTVAERNAVDGGDQPWYVIARYGRILAVLDHYLGNRDIRAQLCLLNKLPRDGDPKLDLGLLREAADHVASKYDGLDGFPRGELVVVTSQNFEDEKAKLMEALGRGARRCVLSAYQTLGAGQNLQYPVPDGEEPVCVNSFAPRPEIDFDAIYLDRPTNLLVNILGEHLEDADFAKYLFQLESLLEEGAVSLAVFEAKLDEAFQCHVGRRSYRKIDPCRWFSLHQTESCTRFVNQVLIQAVGRICRTNRKRSTVHLLADTWVRDRLARFRPPTDMLLVHEYRALLQAAGQADAPDEYVRRLENRASIVSSRNMAFIRRMLATPWTAGSATEWQDLRTHVLKHPALDDLDPCDSRFRRYYVEQAVAAASYSYDQTGDYGRVTVRFSRGGSQQVSSMAAHLSELIRAKEVAGLFEANGWATATRSFSRQPLSRTK